MESWGESDYESELKILRHHTNINEWIHLFIDANKLDILSKNHKVCTMITY